MLNCPKCGTDNIDGETVCATCGYQFRSAAQAAFDAPAKPPAASSPFFGWSWVCFVAGAAGLFTSTQMPLTAPYSDTLNIGLLQQQKMMFDAGLAMILVGAILMAAHGVIVAMHKAR